MGTIRIKDGRYSAAVRIKNKQLYCTFGDKETAELWVKYKEDLLNNMAAFDPSLQELVRLEDAIDLKLKEIDEKDGSARERHEIRLLKNYFRDFLDENIGDITTNMLLQRASEMLHETVKKGGRKDDPTTGIIRQTSPATVRRKFAMLSIIFSYMIKKGINITNPVTNLFAYLKDKKIIVPK